MKKYWIPAFAILLIMLPGSVLAGSKKKNFQKEPTIFGLPSFDVVPSGDDEFVLTATHFSIAKQQEKISKKEVARRAEVAQRHVQQEEKVKKAQEKEQGRIEQKRRKEEKCWLRKEEKERKAKERRKRKEERHLKRERHREEKRSQRQERDLQKKARKERLRLEVDQKEEIKRKRREAQRAEQEKKRLEKIAQQERKKLERAKRAEEKKKRREERRIERERHREEKKRHRRERIFLKEKKRAQLHFEIDQKAETKRKKREARRIAREKRSMEKNQRRKERQERKKLEREQRRKARAERKSLRQKKEQFFMKPDECERKKQRRAMRLLPQKQADEARKERRRKQKTGWHVAPVTTSVSPVQFLEKQPQKEREYGISLKDTASAKKDALKVDLSISSTVPVNVEVQDDRVVIKQVRQEEMKKVVALDLTKKESCRKHLYKVPAWPMHARFFEEKDKVDVTVRYQRATSSYSSSGNTQDISKLVFGEPPMYVRDVLLASKLVEAGTIKDYSGGTATSPNNYLAGVAGQKLCWDGSTDDVQVTFGYVRHFKNKDISLGVELPFVYRRHCLKLTTTVNQKAETSTTFKSRYSSDFKTFVKDILAHKDSALTESDSEKGIGDLSAFINLELNSKHCERAVIGLKALLPTAKERNVHKLWDPELGNGGFAELTAFGSILFGKNAHFNPHGLLQATYCFAADVNRRIPSYRVFDGVGQELGHILAMGEYVRGNGAFSNVDTTFRRFATETERIRIRKGAEVSLRVGNMFEGFLCRRGFADIYYDVRAKGKDHINKKNLADSFVPTILTNNTFEVEQRLGFTWSYQFDKDVRAMLGALYSVAGRNVPKTFEANVLVSAEF